MSSSCNFKYVGCKGNVKWEYWVKDKFVCFSCNWCMHMGLHDEGWFVEAQQQCP